MHLNQTLINYFSERYRGMIIGLLLAVFLVYLPFINNALFFDDLPFFGGPVTHYTEPQFHFELRFLPYTSLGLTWKYFSDTPMPLHLGNILLHSANTLLVFFLLQKLTSLIIQKSSPFTDLTLINPSFLSSTNWGAWLGALCFACHPVAVYATGYLVQRSILMATLFTLAMQLAFLRGLISPQKYQQYAWLTISVLFYSLAVFSKEHSLMAPAILIAMALLFKPLIRANRIALATAGLGFIFVAIFVILKIKGIFGVAYEHDAAALFEQQAIISSSQNLHLLSIFTQAGLFFKYLLLWVIPNPSWMSIDMRESFTSSVGAWQSWIKISCFMLYGIISLKLLLHRGKLALIGFALIYPWLMFIVEFSSVRVQEPFVLYRSYLWIPGLLLLIPLLLDSLSNKKVIIATFLIILALIPLSWNRLWVFADDYRLWNDAAILLPNKVIPGAARIFYNRGNAEINKQKFNEAIVDFKRVIAIDPKIDQVYVNLGSAYLGINQYALGLESFNQAIAINHNNGQAYLGKGFALKRLNDRAAFIEAINTSCEFKNATACLLMSLSKKMELDH